ncbi:hypothetical protein DESPIG_02397, partial [Desulfovibrio piger ATCC 29098]
RQGEISGQTPGFPGGFEEGRRLLENAARLRPFPGEPAWSAGGPRAHAAKVTTVMRHVVMPPVWGRSRLRVVRKYAAGTCSSWTLA